MAWQDRLRDPDGRPIFWFFAEGIPHVLPSCQDLGWSAPQCARYGSAIPDMTVHWDTLRVREGLQALGWRVGDRGGIAGPGRLTVSFVDRQGAMARLFASRLSTAHRTHLTDTLGWDAAGTGECRYSMKVKSTSAFAGTGVLYVGRETIWYGAKSAGLFGSSPEDAADMKRGCYAPLWSGSDARDRWHLAYRHVEDGSPGILQEEVADHPYLWKGRRCVLVMSWCHADGVTPWDDGFWDGDNWCEVFGGRIASDPICSGPDWRRWSLEVEPLTDYLRTQVGAHAAVGEIGLPSGATPYIHLSDGNNWLRITAKLSSETPPMVQAVLRVQDGGAVVDDRWVTLQAYMRLVADTLEAYLQASWATWPDHAGGWVWADRDHGRLFLVVKWQSAPIGEHCELTVVLGVIGDGLSTASVDPWPTKWSWRDDEIGQLAWVVSDGSAGETDLPSPMLSMTSRRIPFRLTAESQVFGRQFAASGYALLPTKEVVAYTSVEDIDGEFQALVVSGGGRGALGTAAHAEEIAVDEHGEVLDALGVRNIDAWTLILRMALSTGVAGLMDDDYDVLVDAWGAKLDPSMFDVGSFGRLQGADGGIRRRTLALVKPLRLDEIVETEARFASALVTARTDRAGRFRIGAHAIEDAIAVWATRSVESAKADLAVDSSRPINVVTVPTQWDAGKSEHVGTQIIVRNKTAVAAAQVEESVDLAVKGFALGYGSASTIAYLLAQGIFRRFGRRVDRAEIHASLEAALMEPGDSILVTVPLVPTMEGTTGWLDRVALVVGVEWSAFNAGSSKMAGVHVLVGPELRVSSYAPNAVVTAYSAGTPSITLSDNDFCDEADRSPVDGSPCRDWHWFAAGMRIWVWQRGDYAGGVARTIQSSPSDGVFILDSALGWTPGSDDTLVGYDHWTSGITTGQKMYTFIADNTPDLGAGDDPYEFA